MQYQATVTIEQKAGMLDPEGTTAQRALGHLGYKVSSVKTAKLYEIVLEAESQKLQSKKLTRCARSLLQIQLSTITLLSLNNSIEH